MAVVSDQQVAALRASLTFDAGLAREWQAYLIGSGDLDGFSELVYAAFAVAARRYFGGEWTRADVVRYVGSVRARGPADDEIDPVTAEALILRALGAELPLRAAEEVVLAVQTIVLGALIADLGLAVTGIDVFLAEARVLADRWFCGVPDGNED